MDKNKLMYEMAKQKVSILDMCHKLNMSRSAFYRKCNGISEFTQGEIQKIDGVIYIVDAYGTFEQNEEPSYDIEALYRGEVTLFKHVRESEVSEREN